jgi:nucleotide-binding universal stress UspA family protein
MTVFIQKGDAPLSLRQATKRGMAHVAAELAQAGARTGDEELLRVIPHADLTPRLAAVVQALGHVSYQTYALAWEADNLTNGEHNMFNHQLAAYRAAQARLARYQLADGRPEVTDELQAAIEPLPAEVEQPVYGEETGEQTGTEMVPNPEIVRDDAERTAAQAAVNDTSAEVIEFAQSDPGLSS